MSSTNDYDLPRTEGEAAAIDLPRCPSCPDCGRALVHITLHDEYWCFVCHLKFKPGEVC